jgi:nucleoid-associated protein YgaU
VPVSPTSRHHLLDSVDAPDATGVSRRAVVSRPQPPLPATARRHVVIAGETIESIARRELGTSEAWWLIADANPRVFPLDIKPGTVLAIPTRRPAVERNRTF